MRITDRSSIISVLLLCADCPLSAVVASDSSSSADALEGARLYSTLPPIVFAPTGRLYGVERVASESFPPTNDESSCAIIALRCGPRRKTEDRSCLGGESKRNSEFAIISGIGAISPFLHQDEAYDADQDSKQILKGRRPYLPLVQDFDEIFDHDAPTSPISIVSPNLVVGAGGKGTDSAILLRRAIEAALSSFRYENGGIDWFASHSLEEVRGINPSGGASGVDATSLARKIADFAQRSTQTLGGKSGRMLASSLIAVGVNNFHPSQHGCEFQNTAADAVYNDDICIWRVDPTGQFWRVDASAVGRGSINIESVLLDKVRQWMKNDPNQPMEGEVKVSNENVKAYLSSLTVEESLVVAHDCLVKGIIHSNGLSNNAAQEIKLRRKIQTAIIRPNHIRNTNPSIELIHG